LAWSLWLLRNDLIFSNFVALSPDVCIFQLSLSCRGGESWARNMRNFRPIWWYTSSDVDSVC
jgi:hypothetical protein